ncbi:galectin-5-like [Spodoptera frugiperda]|uniref:Galectin n=1 Tax=Spodoptera frugiperda TaxID=7108 RepID=A0A9R0F4A5_SPOFR|nr:galectin-5-like [Spodoptera frugiperda]
MTTHGYRSGGCNNLIDYTKGAPPVIDAGVKKVPHTGPIPGGMYPGRIVRIKGGICPTAYRFSINFKCGGSDDTAFHFNPRFGHQVIVRNSYINGSWGNEESSGGMPMGAGEMFETVVKCFHDCFKVSVNGRHFCDYYHRLPYHRITHLNVGGDLMIQQITFAGPEPPSEIANYAAKYTAD